MKRKQITGTTICFWRFGPCLYPRRSAARSQAEKSSALPHLLPLEPLASSGLFLLKSLILRAE